MKIKFPICNLRFSIVPAKRAGSNRRSSSGIALVITLILLAVTLVMALAFLAISRRESGSVVTAADTATARLAADSALANAEAQVISGILSSTNPYNFGLVVSTNFLPPLVNPPNPSLADLLNLQFSPRAPVLISQTEPAGRFYLDLNRNGRFDTNGVVGNFDANNNLLGTVTQVGDPEWIGVLEHPDAAHGPNNKFISRYAFIALPVGNSLDLNAIHNQTHNPNLISAQDGYFRNEGVGSWEINLAAFLADLNTNEWNNTSAPYYYGQPFNTGNAFADAFSLLSYRYGYNYNTLAVPPLNFYNALENQGVDGYTLGNLMTATALPLVNPPVTGNNSPWAGSDNTNHFFTPSDLFDPTKTSGGATGGFTNRLLNAGAQADTYDRYTFYRLLSQLGTDTAPESGKLNLNYRNVTNGVIVPGMETNFYPWSALEFFTNAADRMLRQYTTRWFQSNPTNFLETYYGIVPNNYIDATGFGVTNISAFGLTNQIPSFGIGNIPVYIGSQFVYTPAVNRLLQLAANIYDATTNSFFPSVFRPVFTTVLNGTNRYVYVSGYTNMINNGNIQFVSENDTNLNPDLALPVEVTASPAGTNILENIYGVPWIIGAKKGLPNFNKFSMESAFQITRKLQFTRNTNSTPWQYASNQMYFMGITNYYGAQCWNSYAANYTNPVSIVTRLNIQMNITNDAGLFYNPYPVGGTNVQSFPYYTTWPAKSFKFPLSTNLNFPFLYISNGAAIYYYGNSIAANNSSLPPQFIPQITNQINGQLNYQDKGTPPLPHFVLVMTNRLQLAIIDYSAGLNNGRVIDYVNLNGMDPTNDLNSEIAYNQPTDETGLWDANLAPGTSMTFGVYNQVKYSKYGNPVGWTQAAIPGSKLTSPEAEYRYFNKFFASTINSSIVVSGVTYPVTFTSTNLQAPYTPTLNLVQRYTWQANDPLVHYLITDLNDSQNDTSPQLTIDWPGNWPGSIILINEDRYAPWGITGNASTPDDPKVINSRNMTLKDPLVISSDAWTFPTNKLPTVGWLGRVHRGTPWQTVYLKSTDIIGSGGLANWQTWTGNGNQYDAINAAPVQDRQLFDIFTTAFNDNATRGQLSVNVAAGNSDPAAGIAAWAAALSGIALPPVSVTNTYTVIQPAGDYSAALPLTNQPPLAQIVAGINYTRANFVSPGGLQGSFQHVGDILATPQFTEQSPFLNLANTNYNTDQMYEWLPQQAISLLRVGTPRYVIYSYGQTLKPANNAVWTASTPPGTFGLVTNYQVVSETATRAVVRIESTVTNIVVNGIPTAAVTNNRAVIESFNILPPD
jgi:hypothetical protein